MNISNKSFTLLEVIITTVLLAVGIGGGLVGYNVANERMERSNLEHILLSEVTDIAEYFSSLDIDDEAFATPNTWIDITDIEHQKLRDFNAQIRYKVTSKIEGARLHYKEVTIDAQIPDKKISLATQTIKPNIDEPIIVCVPHCPQGYCGDNRCGENCLCPVGQICINDVCVGGSGGKRCTSEGLCSESGTGKPCSEDLECQNGGQTRCTPDGLCSIDGRGIFCEVDSDCQDTRCTDDGRCVSGGNGMPCNLADDCTVTRCTQDGICALDGIGIFCSQDSDCENTRCTQDGRCTLYGTGDVCSAAADCTTSQKRCASGGRCTFEGTGETCRIDADCESPSETRCTFDGRCSVSGRGILCSVDSDCESSQDYYNVCDRGSCVRRSGIGVDECNNDRDCIGYSICDDVECPSGYYCNPHKKGEDKCQSEIKCEKWWQCQTCHKCDEHGRCVPERGINVLNENCPKGFHCKDGECIEDEPCNTCYRRDVHLVCRPISSECGGAEDCYSGSNNYRCDQGRCIRCKNCRCGQVEDGQCTGCRKRCVADSDGNCTIKDPDDFCAYLCNICGNGACDAGENCSNCPADCGCPSGKYCEGSTCKSCPTCSSLGYNCGSHSTACGTINCGSCTRYSCLVCINGTCVSECTSDEWCDDFSCVPKTFCGNGACDAGENCSNCPADCGCPSGKYCEGSTCKSCPTCSSLGYNCGSHSTACGTINCGSCSSGSPHCLNGRCVQCLDDGDCRDDDYCSNGFCVPY